MGPFGLGPMTGRRAGLCAGYSVPGYANPCFGRGFGRGRMSGRGFGFGWARNPYAYGNSYGAPVHTANFTPNQEVEMLQAEAKAMQEGIEAINSRLKDLESARGAEGKD